MRITIPNHYSMILFCIFLFICVGLILSCDESPSSPGEQDTQDTSDVRQPAAGQDPDAFWNTFYWSELNSAEQALWGVLGWNEASWQGISQEPASESKAWNELTEEESSAAEQLGYNEMYWDSV